MRAWRLLWCFLLLCATSSAAQNPVPLLNRQHPLARGLILLLYGVPGYTGTLRYYDLARGHHGQLTGTTDPGWVSIDALPGLQTVAFDGVNDRVLIDSTSALQPASLTWLAYATSATASQPQFAMIFGKESSYDLTANPTGSDSTRTACFVGNADNPQAVTPTGSLPLGAWVWTGCTFDPTRGSDQLRAFINGKRLAQATSALPIPYTGTQLFFGGNIPGAVAFHGGIGPVFVWNYALSDTQMLQVQQLAERRFPGLLLQPGVTATLPFLTTLVPPKSGMFPFFPSP